jgi:Protein of unknown function (DUF2442)
MTSWWRTGSRLRRLDLSLRSRAFDSVGDVSDLPRVVDVEHLGALSLRLTFDDGLVRDLDLGPMLHGGVLRSLRDTALFATAYVDETARTVAWSNGVDLDPDVLHGDYEPASGAGPRVLAERRLKPAG